MILYAKYGHHRPLNRQSQSFARESIDRDVSTMADGSAPARQRWPRWSN
jgi:transposase